MNFSVAFTKGGNGLTRSSQPGMMSLIRSTEYSDVESSDEDLENANDDANDESEVGDEPTEVQHTYERYGIGAKLLIKMGYEQGKALGTGDKGLVVPIETKLRPKGLGVGGIKEKTPQAEVPAQLQQPLDDGSQLDAKLLRSYIQLIDQLEDLGISVPETYRHAAESRSTTLLETHNLRLRRISLALVALSEEEGDLKAALAQLPKLQEALNEEINATICDEDILKSIQSGTRLARECLAQVSSDLVFLTLIDMIKDEVSLEDLAQFRHLYEEKFGVTDQFDSWINDFAGKRCKQALEEGEFETVKSITFLLPQVIEEVVVPIIQSQLHQWNPFRERPPSLIFECIGDFRFDLSTLRKLMAPVEAKVWEFVHNLGHEAEKASKDDLSHYRAELRNVSDTWSHLIARARGPDSWSRIETEIWRMFLAVGRLVAELPINAFTRWVLDIIFDINDELVREIIFLMGFGNAWIRQGRKHYNEASWLQNWVTFFWANGFGDEDIVRWYVNKACHCKHHPTDPIELPKLKWKQNPEPPSNPSVDTVIEYLKSINASCIH